MIELWIAVLIVAAYATRQRYWRLRAPKAEWRLERRYGRDRGYQVTHFEPGLRPKDAFLATCGLGILIPLLNLITLDGFNRDGVGSIITVPSSIRNLTDPAFGGVGDDATNNTLAFSLAMDDANGGGLFVPEGIYRLDPSAFTDWNGLLYGIPGKSILKFTTSSAADLLHFEGTRDDSRTLVGAPAAGTRTATVSSATGLAVGDWIEIHSTALWATANDYKGEWCQIEAISGNTLTFYTTLHDSYLNGDEVRSYTKSQPQLQGITILGPGNNVLVKGLVFEHCMYPVAEDCKVTGTADRAYYAANCVAATFSRMAGSEFTNTAVSTGNQYGVSIAGGTGARITYSNLAGGRHAVSLGSSPDYGPCRNVQVIGCTLASFHDSLLAADVHGPCQFVTYTNNTIYNGFQTGGEKVVLEGNTIFCTPSGNGIITRSDLVGFDFIARHNTIIRPIGTSGAIFFNNSSDTPARGGGALIIESNDIYLEGGSTADQISLSCNAAITMDEVSILNNRIHGSASLTTHAVSILFANMTIPIMAIDENRSTGGRMRIRSQPDYLFVRWNALLDCANQQGIDVQGDSLPVGTGVKVAIYIEGNTVENALEGMEIRGAETTAVTKPACYVRNNTIRNFSVNGIDVGDCGHVDVLRNDFRADTVAPSGNAFVIAATNASFSQAENRLFGLDSGGNPLSVSISSSVAQYGVIAPLLAATMGVTDDLAACDATAGAFALTLPAASKCRGMRDRVIKKIDASGNAVTVTRAGSDTIQGATTVVLSAQWQSVTLRANTAGNGWLIVAVTS